KLQNHLANARIFRARNLRIRSGSQAGIRSIEVRVVHDVEKLAAKLQRAVLEAEILVRRHVENDQPGAANGSASSVSIKSGRRLYEGAAAEPVSDRLRVVDGCDRVGPGGETRPADAQARRQR